jgi:hypothetical protein
VPSAQPASSEAAPLRVIRGGAAELSPSDRKTLAVKALAQAAPVTQLANGANVSRKFIYGQLKKADSALDEVFAEPTVEDDAVLFYLPVTKDTLSQLVIALFLHTDASIYGAQGVVKDVFDHHLSVGTIHNIGARVVPKARECNAKQDQALLPRIKVGAQDEIFQGDPVLVGVDPHSTYCYLLAQEPHRDATTWGVHLLDLEQRGLEPDHTIADAGSGLRAGQAEAWPGIPCWGDVFHAVRLAGQMTIYLDNRAYGAITKRDKLERRMRRAKRRGKGQGVSKELALARAAETQAIALADDMRVLSMWLQQDVLALAGPSAEIRRELFDFIVAEMLARENLASHRIKPVRVALANQRDDLLAFAEEIDRQLVMVAGKHEVALQDVRALFENSGLSSTDPRYWQNDSAVRKRLGERYRAIRDDVRSLAENIVRASSMVENINSRLRRYFFIRRTLGSDYLELLRFFLNNRRYPRSRKESRVKKSPAEILGGQPQPNWLELLGFKPFRKAAA